MLYYVATFYSVKGICKLYCVLKMLKVMIERDGAARKKNNVNNANDDSVDLPIIEKKIKRKR